MGYSDEILTNYDPSKTVAESIARLKSVKVDDKIYLNNNVNYGVGIEYSGKSKKAPAGMLRINVARWAEIVDKAAKKTKLQLSGKSK